MLNYLQRWIDQLRWQRLEPFQKLAKMLLKHLDGILNCSNEGSPGSGRSREWEHQVATTSRAGIPEPAYLLLKAQRIAATNTEFVVFRKAA
jgi:hypothetical protein